MNVRVEAAGSEDFAFPGDHFGAGSDDDADAGLNVRIAGFADGRDVSALDADVGLDDSPVVEDERVGDDRVDGALPVADLALSHAVADHLAAAEFHFLAVDAKILLHLDDEIGVGQANAVACRRPEHVRVDGTAQTGAHGLPRLQKSPMLSPPHCPRVFRYAFACNASRRRYPIFQIAGVWFHRTKVIAKIGSVWCRGRYQNRTQR